MFLFRLCLVTALAAAVASASSDRADFTGYRVVSARPGSDANAALLRDMEAAAPVGIEFWSPPSPDADANVTLSVHPDLVSPLEEFFHDNEIGLDVVAEDLQVFIQIVRV